jgi:diacylglycerol kinase (ATP)
MSEARTLFIVNPNAGSVEGLETLHDALGSWPGAELRATRKEGDARRLARQAVMDGTGLVVAAGGDGTLNEVVNGLSENFGKTRLGLLPLGTGNDFARSIHVPADLEGALEILWEGRVRAVDVGHATFGGESRWFINMAAGGFSGQVSEKADEVKERWGPLAYLRAAAGTLFGLQGFNATFRIDGGEPLELETYNVVVSNGRFVAAGIPVAPHSELDDGLLDLMLVPTTTLPQLARLVPQILLGKHGESDPLIIRELTTLEIESDPPMAFNLDGELIGEGPIRFDVLPRALEVIVGPEETD